MGPPSVRSNTARGPPYAGVQWTGDRAPGRLPRAQRVDLRRLPLQPPHDPVGRGAPASPPDLPRHPARAAHRRPPGPGGPPLELGGRARARDHDHPLHHPLARDVLPAAAAVRTGRLARRRRAGPLLADPARTEHPGRTARRPRGDPAGRPRDGVRTGPAAAHRRAAARPPRRHGRAADRDRLRRLPRHHRGDRRLRRARQSHLRRDEHVLQGTGAHRLRPLRDHRRRRRSAAARTPAAAHPWARERRA